jgi:Arc/MetJ-type ribon-helix-helix transcriptional regulator
MAPKRKVVFTAEPTRWERVEALVREGRYGSASEFLREAIDRRCAEIEAEALAAEVERYCDAGHAGEDDDLVAGQALDEAP